MSFLTEKSVCNDVFCRWICFTARFKGMLAIKQSLNDCIPQNTCENLSRNCERKIAEIDPGVLFDEIRERPQNMMHRRHVNTMSNYALKDHL